MSRVAVVTGGASGIGLAVCQHLAAQGHRIAVFDINGDAVRQAVKDLEADGADAFGAEVDVSNRAAVDAAVAAVRDNLGPIGILVTSAGVEGEHPFTEMPVEAWDRLIGINLTGTFHCAQAVVPDMIEAGWGRIVTISSCGAQTGAPNRAHYVASKGGVIALTKALAVEFAPQGITVNTIPPSLIDTPMFRTAEAEGRYPGLDAIAAMIPVRRAGTPRDVAATCAFLCSEDAGFITGQQIGVNGGSYL